MTITTPEQWPTTQYKRFIRMETSGKSAHTHLAEVATLSGEVCRAYVKHYGPARPHGLFNEWFGHIVLGALNVPQPPAALMPVHVPGTTLLAWAFCSLEPTPRFDGSAKQLYSLDDPAQHEALLRRLFADCAHTLPRLIAADQLLMQGDRNIGNILFTGKSHFLAIDNGEILGGAQIQRAELVAPRPWSRSKLIEDLVPISALKPGFCNALVAAAQLAVVELHGKQPAIQAAIGYPANAETAVPYDAVWWRGLELERLFAEKLGVMI